MPDDGSPARGTYAGKIIRDPTDMRDLIYRPTLGLLPDRFLGAGLHPDNAEYRQNLNIRNQGNAPSCVGESLAAVIDIQRIETYFKVGNPTGAKADVWPASGAMLYAMALEIESTDQGEECTEVYSLRSGLKGFYNTGVCTERTWGTLDTKVARFDEASVPAMREARNVTLGAYFRVQPFINDYHAALIEAGALYVSAELHDGWKTPVDGMIAPRGGNRHYSGGHAFVIVGYERRGFLVLNSWGPEWGGYAFGGSAPIKGIALWTYEDWAACVIDAWVLRLAAPTPDAFRFTVGPQGTTLFGGEQIGLAAPSVRRLEVLGHYIHLDDGRHAATGSYPSSRQSLETTLAHLASDAKAAETDIRLTIHGDVMPTHEVLARISRTHAADKAAGVHGLSLLWVNGLLSEASEALQPLFESALSIAKGNREDADRRIERMTRPVGRALWRDARRAADCAAARDPDGDAAHALDGIVRLCINSGKRLHVVSEGAGILLLDALLRNGKGRAGREMDLSGVLASITMVAPLITEANFNNSIGRFLRGWRKRTGRRATIFRAGDELDQRLSIGTYSRSWTDLVSRAFEDRPTRLVASHDFKGSLSGKPERRALATPQRPDGDLSTAHVLEHKDVADHVAEEIRKSQAGSTG
jgi:hypothetical protein